MCGVVTCSGTLKKKGGFTGNEEDIKMMVKYKFLGTEDLEISNTTIPAQVRRTSTLDRGEMLYFMQQVEAWCIDLGVKLTKPQNSEYSKLGG